MSVKSKSVPEAGFFVSAGWKFFTENFATRMEGGGLERHMNSEKRPSGVGSEVRGGSILPANGLEDGRIGFHEFKV